MKKPEWNCLKNLQEHRVYPYVKGQKGVAHYRCGQQIVHV